MACCMRGQREVNAYESVKPLEFCVVCYNGIFCLIQCLSLLPTSWVLAQPMDMACSFNEHFLSTNRVPSRRWGWPDVLSRQSQRELHSKRQRA